MPVRATVTPPMTPPNFTCVNLESPLDAAGVSLHHPLESLNKLKLKRTIEAELLKLDNSTKEQRVLESEKITSRISRVDLLITSLTFYTSLILQWLTLVDSSTSFTNFLYEIFIGSFNFTRWNFSNIETIGKISGVTTSLQVILFIVSNLIIFLYEIFHRSKSAPTRLSGPTYFGGPLQLFNVLRTKVHEHNKSTRKLDAKLSQYLGIASQLLIIATAIVTDSKKFPVLNDFVKDVQNFTLPAGLGSSFVERSGSTSQNVTRTDFAVKHAALFAKTTLLVSTLAIMMTSLLNIIAWMADVWKANQDEIIVYEAFKWMTKLVVCEPCCVRRSSGGDEDAPNEVDEFEMAANASENPPQNYPYTIND